MKLLISIATRIIPRHYLQHVSHFFLRIFSLFLRGNKFEDPINGKTYIFGISMTRDEKKAVINETKNIYGLKEAVASIILVEDLSRNKN